MSPPRVTKVDSISLRIAVPALVRGGCRSSCGRAVDMEHRAVAIRLGLNEVEHEGHGESREQREPVSERHRLNYEPVLVDQAEPAERLGEGGPSPRDEVLPWLTFE